MSAIKLWKEEYRIGNEAIDRQHMELFHKVEELLTIAMTGNESENRKECKEIVDFLISYTAHHFETEEALQKEICYIDRMEHAKIHKEFANTILDYQKKVEQDFSKETLKKLAGTMMTWLILHVCDCDRKIMENRLISPEMTFDDAEDVICKVTEQLLADTYSIAVQRATASVYKGYVEGKVIVRTIISLSKNYVFLIGYSEGIARELYKKISGMEIGSLNALNAVESSAFIEISDLIASHAVSYIDQSKKPRLEWRGDIFMDEYSNTCVDIKNSVLLDFDTDYGRLEVMYCLAD